AFEQELLRRGYHAVENAGQLVIFCNQEPIRIIV
ncbi:MAG TPA: N-(5'-phosphoribosyl)anthranilate isomerase, partial [Sulfitobacter pontiacus]|nr:N-(5'-phosphoribosyl)anthranilate isomerase [Sulfitobacter pontiacus]